MKGMIRVGWILLPKLAEVHVPVVLDMVVLIGVDVIRIVVLVE